jgi:hypothetical protein
VEPLYYEVRNYFLTQQGYSTLKREKISSSDSSPDMAGSDTPPMMGDTPTTINDDGFKEEVELKTNRVVVYSSKPGH